MNNKKENKQENAELALNNQFTQANIPQFLAQVDEKIKELTKGKADKVIVQVPFPGFGLISSNESVSTLAQALSNLDAKEVNFKNTVEKYNEIDNKTTLLIAGHSVSVWREEILSRITEVSHKKELAKLRTIKKTLEENLSAEAKLANDLKNIANLLSE